MGAVGFHCRDCWTYGPTPLCGSCQQAREEEAERLVLLAAPRACALAGCEAVFLPARPHQEYCSGAHRQAAYRRRLTAAA
jgi:hypothetical protein